MELGDWLIIALLFVWCFGLSYYLWRTQMFTSRLLLRIMRLEERERARTAAEEATDAHR